MQNDDVEPREESIARRTCVYLVMGLLLLLAPAILCFALMVAVITNSVGIVISGFLGPTLLYTRFFNMNQFRRYIYLMSQVSYNKENIYWV